MRNRSSVALAGLLLASAVSTAQAQVVDQFNYQNHGFFGFGDVWNGQTFTPSANTSAGAGFNLMHRGNVSLTQSGFLTIQLWSDVASNSGATLLASGSTPFTLLYGQQSMFDVFWAAVAVTPGTQYFLTMNAANSGVVTTISSPSDLYAGGGAWYNDNTSVTAFYGDYSGRFDMTFEEFAASPITTPEPASMVLMATGLVGVFGTARRLRKGSRASS